MAKPNWKNRTLWTKDNLSVMRGMNSKTIDLVYLDPPFNSNRDYVATPGSKADGASFKDTWDFSDDHRTWLADIKQKNFSLYKLLNAMCGIRRDRRMLAYLVYISIRLMEMRRLLKSSGSIYLHCDSTASHYLKLIMDVVFGEESYINEIIWKRTTAHGGAKRYGRIHDVILFYSRTKNFTWNKITVPFSKEYINDHYPLEDSRGRYRKVILTAKGATSGDAPSGQPWRGFNPPPGRHWSVSKKARKALGIDNNLTTQEKLDALDAAGFIFLPKKSGMPSLKFYLDWLPEGLALQDIWNDVSSLKQQSSEKTGYPTQKPFELLRRIILSSTNKGDVVMDPFCGSGTTLVVAERHDRRWVGIDVSSEATALVKYRMRKELGFFNGGEAVYRKDILCRTDAKDKSTRRKH